MATTSKNTLSIESRSATGTTAAHALRHLGKVPGILFGHGSDPLPISVDARSLDDLIVAGGRTRLLSLLIDGTTSETALLRDLQRDPVTRRVIHADLQRVSATESIYASLRIVTVGLAEGVKNSGGVLDVITHEVEVQGPANALPEKIEIDVTELGIHDHITAGQIPLPPAFKMVTPADTVIVTVEPSRTAGEVEAAAPAPVAAAEVPTVAETTKGSES
jgi:large subunit ribosomal protein L25